LAVGSPGEEEAHGGAEKDVERMMAGIHDAGSSNKGGSNEGSDNENGFPYFSSVVEDVKFAGEVDTQVA
jgi:hypothetical protein